MQRLLLKQLLSWAALARRKPVLLDGARQSGKSYLLKELFGKVHFPKVHVVDFLKTPKASILFDEDLEPERWVNDLSLLLNTPINPAQDLIIFDEVGECPNAVQALKFIAEEQPTWFVCASGSNIGLLNHFPVGKVHGLTLRPMNFEEFLYALGSEQQRAAYQAMDRRELVHQQLWPLLMDYFFVGGMPEAVACWKATQGDSLIERRRNVRQLQQDIIQGYERDFGKYAGKVNALHINQVFASVVGQLQKNIQSSVKRYTFNQVIEKKKAYRDFANIIDWLEKTHLLSKCYVINQKPISPLRMQRKASFFKLFYMDVGLLCCQLGISESVLARKDMIYKGPIVENFVQNELLSYGLRESYSWHENTAELEFILDSSAGIIPVEVKAGNNTRAKSLQSYVLRYAPKTTIKLIGAVGGSDDSERVLPLYYARALLEYIE